MRIILTLLSILLAPALWAQPVPYALDPDRSTVSFSFDILGVPTGGTMPVAEADVALDLRTLANSRTDVTLDAAGAVTDFGPATQAMRGAGILNTDDHPTITFTTTGVSGTFAEGRIEGLVTIRGTTRPVVMAGQVLRQAGTDPGDTSNLAVRLTGEVNRFDFGLDGFADLVGPMIGLDITTILTRQ